MDEQDFHRQLIQRYLDGTATDGELEVFFDLLERGVIHVELDRQVDAAYRQAVGDTAVRKSRRLVSWLPYAAAVLLVASIVGWWVVGIRPSAVDPTKTEIVPGGNRATLTLADGRTITLDETQTGITIGAEDITYMDGSAVDAMSSETEGRRGASLLELTTPKGGTYQVTLPDGSRVWLNAASTLRYPSRFGNDERVVMLEGEAFFEIKEMQGTRAPSSSAGARVPFKVQTSGQTIEVLGTEFNVSAYMDEAVTKTTLVAGKVQIVNAQAGTVNQLRPGQQAALQEATVTVNEVDTEQYTAWKDGKFMFNDTDIHTIMRQLARWYDADVVFETDLSHVTFTGSISRFDDIQDVLRKIGLTESINFKTTGRRIVVSQ